MDNETITETKGRPSDKTYGSKMGIRRIGELGKKGKKSGPQVSEIILLTSYPPGSAVSPRTPKTSNGRSPKSSAKALP